MSRSSSNTAENFDRRLSDSQAVLIDVLRAMHKDNDERHYQIGEISLNSGVGDDKETQRHLFILEGQKLVSPFPEGDFTAKTWFITKMGIKALKTIEQQMNPAA